MVLALCSGICIPFAEAPTLAAVEAALPAVLYGGFCSVGLGYTFQMLAQKYAEPTKASLLFACESVFAAIGGALILKERMTLPAVIGCVLIFLGILLSQMPCKAKKDAAE